MILIQVILFLEELQVCLLIALPPLVVALLLALLPLPILLGPKLDLELERALSLTASLPKNVRVLCAASTSLLLLVSRREVVVAVLI